MLHKYIKKNLLKFNQILKPKSTSAPTNTHKSSPEAAQKATPKSFVLYDRFSFKILFFKSHIITQKYLCYNRGFKKKDFRIKGKRIPLAFFKKCHGKV